MSIVYVGEDVEVMKELKQAFLNKAEVCFELDFRKTIVSYKEIEVLVIDFTFFKLTPLFMTQLMAFKQMLRGKHTPIVGMFVSKEELLESRLLLSKGICYTHIKGADTSIFMKDLAWLAFNEKRNPLEFATSRDFSTPFNIQFFASLTRLSVESMTLETDIIPEGEVDLEFEFFDSAKPQSLTLQDTQPLSRHFDFLHSFQLTLTYPSKWDTFDVNVLQEDTVETIISNLSHQKIGPSVCLLTENAELIDYTLQSFESETKYKISIFDDIDVFKQAIMDNMFNLVFLDLAPQQEAHAFEALSEALLTDSTIRPLLMFFNVKHETEEIVQLLSYERCLVEKSSLELKTLKVFLEKFSSKLKNEEDYSGYFDPTAQSSLAFINHEVMITGISERALYFASPLEIPMFSLFTIDAPVKMFLTVIPLEIRMPYNAKGKIYQALIHGLDHDEEETLRIYVYSIYFEKPQEFGVLASKALKVEVPLALPCKSMAEVFEQELAIIEPIVKVSRKRVTTMLSKL